MKTKSNIIFRLLFTVVGIIFYFTAIAQTIEVPYTLDDRDRMIRLEEQVQSLRNEMQSMRNEFNAKFEALNTKIDSLHNEIVAIYWILGIFISFTLLFIGLHYL
jgi:predicted PurR-regulated permease PerM